MTGRDISDEIQVLCQRYQALALSQDETRLTIALNGDLPTLLLQALRLASGKQVVVEQWPLARLEQARNQQQNVASSTQRIASDDATPSLNDDSDAPAVRFINLTLRSAIQRRASDVHFEPYQHQLRVRLRIDGVLQAVVSPPFALAARVIARLKIMGQLDIAERRLPQDGQLGVQLDHASYSMRISTLPTLYGEKVVLRILQTDRQELSLEQLGMSPADRDRFAGALANPQGLILVTGPTGSGKTVTLYSGLRQLNDQQSNLCSVEDPIEIPVFGINQTQINAKTDLGFARVLRALLRQDPDVIMIGEIRDLETCRIAIQSSLTGHLVLSTLHTNSAAASITRLLDMGVESYLIASTVNGILAQRLVRRLDPATRVAFEAPPELIAEHGLDRLTDRRPIVLYRPGTGGYRGRSAITELLVMNDELRSLLMRQADAATLEQAARRSGLRTLHEEGLRQALAGITSLEEVLRVTRGEGT